MCLVLCACSSAGRAPALQAGGHRFDPGHVHQIPFESTCFLDDRSCVGLGVYLGFTLWGRAGTCPKSIGSPVLATGLAVAHSYATRVPTALMLFTRYSRFT